MEATRAAALQTQSNWPLESIAPRKRIRCKTQRDRRKLFKNSSSSSTNTATPTPTPTTSTTGANLVSLNRRKRLNHKNLFVSAAIYLLPLISLISVTPTVNSQQPLAATAGSRLLPDLASSTSDEPIVAVVGQDAFISCVAKNLQNYTIIWRYTNEANAPAATAATTTTSTNSDASAPQQQQQQQDALETNSQILTAGRQRVVSDNRFSVIQSHDTWLLKISNVRQSDTGTYVCHTNSVPAVRALRILSVVKPGSSSGNNNNNNSGNDSTADGSKGNWGDLDYNFTDCCRAEYVSARCQRLCSFQQLSSRYRSINIVHDCYPSLPAISRCMVGGRNVTDCCERRHIPQKCKPMCGHQGDISAMSVQDQSYCADYSASIMSCKYLQASKQATSLPTICPNLSDDSLLLCSLFSPIDRCRLTGQPANNRTTTTSV